MQIGIILYKGINSADNLTGADLKGRWHSLSVTNSAVINPTFLNISYGNQNRIHCLQILYYDKQAEILDRYRYLVSSAQMEKPKNFLFAVQTLNKFDQLCGV